MTTVRSRRPAVAGYYYPADPVRLRQTIDELMPQAPAARDAATAVILPHGSYRHTGAILAATIGRIRIPRRCILLGPSHTGSWMPWSLMTDGAYRTPLGEIPIDAACADALRQRCPFLEADAWAQRGEHAIEVLLPWVQRCGPSDLSIVPIVMGTGPREEITQLAVALAHVIRMQEEPVLLIASADLSHYEPRERVVEQDRALIDTITELKGSRVFEHLDAHDVVMCGAGAVACILDASMALGATRATLAKYGTSAEAGGDPYAAVGYAGVVIR